MIFVPYSVVLPQPQQPKSITTSAETKNFAEKIAIAKEARAAGQYMRRVSN